MIKGSLGVMGECDMRTQEQLRRQGLAWRRTSGSTVLQTSSRARLKPGIRGRMWSGSCLAVPRALVTGGELDPMHERGLQHREPVTATAGGAGQVDDQRGAAQTCEAA